VVVSVDGVMTRSVRTLASVLLATGALLAVSTGSVSAGGSSWTFDQQHYQPGDTAFAWAAIAWEHNASLGTPDEGPYHAFVIPVSSDAGEPLGPRTPVGDLIISLEPYGEAPVRFGPHHAELTFIIPDVPPGEYVLVHANDAGKTVGDLSGQSRFTIDPRAVRAAPSFAG
jgi:hypothetical protein